MSAPATPRTTTCRICAGPVREFLDLGRQPVSNGFLLPGDAGTEAYFRLAVGRCARCAMVQQLEAVDRDAMFRADYPYRSSTSEGLRRHFSDAARQFLRTELAGADDLAVEIGSNDGIMLGTIAEAGVRHLGVDPCRDAAVAAAANGVRVRVGFFDAGSAAEIRAEDGPASLIFSANTISHVADLGSIFAGVDALLADDGVFVFEDRYVVDIITNTSFDQIYDEHFYLFGVESVRHAVRTYGFELVDVAPISVHGGSVRYSVARPGRRPVSSSVEAMIAGERSGGLADPGTYAAFGARVDEIGARLVGLLTELRAKGHTVLGYGATSKSATVLNYCGIGPELVPAICDSTPEKQGRLTPGTHIPIVPPSWFGPPYPDYALLLAWNHAAEIQEKEERFAAAGGKWIMYVPSVHVQ